MARKIRIDPLDSDSIDLALTLLQRYKKDELQAILTTYPQKLCEKACEAARNAYGGMVNVQYVFGGGTGDGVKYSIVADGDEVCFIEFGAGVYADGSKGFAPQASQSLGFRVSAGSWSMSPEGSKEFLKTDAADQYGYEKGSIPLADWEYNQEARMGLWRAYTEILASFDEVGKEVFLDTNWGE